MSKVEEILNDIHAWAHEKHDRAIHGEHNHEGHQHQHGAIIEEHLSGSKEEYELLQKVIKIIKEKNGTIAILRVGSNADFQYKTFRAKGSPEEKAEVETLVHMLVEDVPLSKKQVIKHLLNIE